LPRALPDWNAGVDEFGAEMFAEMNVFSFLALEWPTFFVDFWNLELLIK
jgi:hypothetical protein